MNKRKNMYNTNLKEKKIIRSHAAVIVFEKKIPKIIYTLHYFLQEKYIMIKKIQYFDIQLTFFRLDFQFLEVHQMRCEM